MPRIQPAAPNKITEDAQETLTQIEQKLGMAPNLTQTLAHSPVTLKSYWDFWQTMSGGRLAPKIRSQVALAVSEANGCAYCVSVHCALGKADGLTADEIADGRQGVSPSSAAGAALHFTREVVDKRGQVSTSDLDRLRRAGFSDEEITEIVGIIVLTLFSNYFNNVAGTVLDFPVAPELIKA